MYFRGGISLKVEVVTSTNLITRHIDEVFFAYNRKIRNAWQRQSFANFMNIRISGIAAFYMQDASE